MSWLALGLAFLCLSLVAAAVVMDVAAVMHLSRLKKEIEAIYRSL